MQKLLCAAVSGAFLFGLTACDSGAKAVASLPAGTASSDAAAVKATKVSLRAEAVPLVGGKPMWAANKSHSAQDNALFQFNKNGASFGAASIDDYVAEAHAFAAKPPKGTEMATRRNGDILLYDPKSNVFAVVTADGAPRTLFKPKGDGAAYWQAQKAKVDQQASGGDRSDNG